MPIFNLKDRTIRLIEVTNVVSVDKKEIAFDTFISQYNLSAKNRETFENFFPVVPSVFSNISGSKEFLELKEVKSIKLSYSADIAVETGIAVAFIQPWYIKPVNISIQGSSYIGAYPYISKEDVDIELIYEKFYNTLAESKGNKNQIMLEIVNNPKKTDRFRGYISSFDFNESVEKPFMLDYDITFLGKPDLKFAIDEGETSVKNDSKIIMT